MGGEKRLPPEKRQKRRGSPPRGRGKGTSLSWTGCMTRITPAWAGKRRMQARLQAVTEDHPRVGGEKRYAKRKQYATLGSPPRGRGKEPRRLQTVMDIRITPAWAGKRLCLTFFPANHGDHPRVGGEKLDIKRASYIIVGSPPRGRGKAGQGLHRNP